MMKSFEFVDISASRRQRRLVGALFVLLVLTTLGLTPLSALQGSELPQIAGVYGATSSVINLATFLLLAGMDRQSRPHRIIAAGYLYSGLMALLHLLTFPGALIPGRSVIGGPDTVGWLFIAWRAGFPLWILGAAIVQRDAGEADAARSAPSPLWMAIAIPAAVFALAQTALLPTYFSPGSGYRFAPLGNTAAYACALFTIIAVAVILRRRLFERTIYLWLMLVLAADAAGLWMSTIGGGRYTVGWYVARVEGLLAAATTLVVLARHLRVLQQSVARTLADLAARTQTLQAEIQRRERAERMLLQSQKLEAVGQLAAGLAHDFNNLMQVIAGRVALVQMRAGDVVQADVEVIRRNIKRAETLTRQLMHFSGRRQLQARTVRLQHLLPELVAMFSSLVRADVTLELQAPDNVWPVEVDPAELEVALANLVTNARDAMPGGGDIRIELRNEQRPDDATGGVVLSVRDSGQGIPPGVLERVFDPFFTTKETGKGTGLGLTQVYAFAKASGGSVAIDSSAGQGTVVSLRFPRAADAPSEARTAGAYPTVAAHRGELVLVVDDHADVREATSMLLEQAGFAVRSASTADEALVLLREGYLKPNILLSDIVLPGTMDGVTLARKVRELLPGVHTVLATGYSDAADRARADGFVVLQKPYETAELTQAVARARAAVPFGLARRR
jgi:signal transduction histidine kinase/ActR/RegA family two-component response regulator